ncbi:GNAT family N-acetyltransferase [Intrasporangium calvum]|uniref:GNAT family N-acetyltransferase n=1 Tax=Intrasporangium calvum TaxID=53358 RepID=UPI000DF5FC36|nr:GNAT family N-acetyltransferase [Intrasporangium calvum]AXG14220.1 GNAT family N-acetyltransferase [Intrasporangium calvum]
MTLDRTALLAAYDDQLRTDAELAGALSVARHGPLVLGTYHGGRGFVTYRDLAGADRAGVEGLVSAGLAHFSAKPGIRLVEWKTRSHDHAPGLTEVLVAAGFEPEEPESIMIGEARRLLADVPLPAGVTLRRITEPPDVRAMTSMVAAVFGETHADAERVADSLLLRLTRDAGMELWVAEADGEIVCAGRLEPVAGTAFAGIWGGATRPDWRGRGIYRALTSERARSAVALGKVFVNSDSTEFSRPILERAGLVKVSTTTPYVWRR